MEQRNVKRFGVGYRWTRAFNVHMHNRKQRPTAVM